MQILYPLMWSRLGRQACREQTVNTVAALSRRGVAVTLLMPRGRTTRARRPRTCGRLVRRRGRFPRWSSGRAAGRARMLVRRPSWLRQLFRDPAIGRRRPALFAGSGDARHGRVPRPCPSPPIITGPGPTTCRRSARFVRRTAGRPQCLGYVLHSRLCRAKLSPAPESPGEKLLVAHNGPEARRRAAARQGGGARRARPAGGPADRRLCRADQRRKGLDQLLALADLRPGRPVPAGRVRRATGPIEAEAAGAANVADPLAGAGRAPRLALRRRRPADPAVAARRSSGSALACCR